MTAVFTPPIARCYAELPSGAILVPGISGGCAGPNAFGACALPAEVRPCSGATWHYPGAAGWHVVVRSESSVCPVAALDPLGPMPIPLD
jgi:hypothetical protein